MEAEILYEEDEEEATVDEVVGVMVTLRKIVKKIRKSTQLRQKLNKCCNMYNVEYRIPVLDVRHRWNSTYDMIQRGKHLKVPLRVLCTFEKKLKHLTITEAEWSQLNGIETILANFKRATLLMSMERHTTVLPAYIATFDWLKNVLQDCVDRDSILSEAAYQGLLKLEKYNLDVKKSTIPFIATVLQPALKLNYFKENNYHHSTIREIKQNISEYFSQNYEGPLSSVLQYDEEEEPDDELYQHMFKRSKTEKMSSELQKYLQLPLANKKTETLHYWKAHVNEFPLLSKMAMDILPVQAASTAVERDFSQGGHVVTPERASLKSETITATMCLKSWMN